MDHYLDIRLLPDPEFTPSLLMNALFAKLHRALVDLDSETIGISFPEVSDTPAALGAQLRLHGVKDDLQALMALNWLTGMSDHCDIGKPDPVPVPATSGARARYRVVRRVQAKSNPERLRRRLIKRKGIDPEDARRAIPDRAAERLKLPFVSVKSRSTGQNFRVFIEHQAVIDEPISGRFSHYGLSADATIPWF